MFHEAGGGSCGDDGSLESSRLRQSSWSGNAGCRWRKPAGTWTFIPGQGQLKPEQQEIERLRREVNKLKAERDILKKATAFFAKEAT